MAADNNFAVVEKTKVDIVGKVDTAEHKAADKGKVADTAERKVADTDKTAERKVADTAECIVDTIENTNKAERRSRFDIN